MWKRADFEKYALRYDETFLGSEDHELWQRVIQRVPVQGMKQCLLLYRQHEEQGNISERTDLANMRLVERFFLKHGIILSSQAVLFAAHREASKHLTRHERKAACREYFAALQRLAKTTDRDIRPYFYREILAYCRRLHARSHKGRCCFLVWCKVLFAVIAGRGIFFNDVTGVFVAVLRKLPWGARLAPPTVSGGISQNCFRHIVESQKEFLMIPN